MTFETSLTSAKNSGSSVSIRNASCNGSIAAGSSTTFGFTANGTAVTATVACTSP